MNKIASIILLLLLTVETGYSQNQKMSPAREHLLMDFGWRFAFGHPYDTKKDFNNGTGYFSYFAKTGYGDGAADPKFDDRTWRKLDLPHDWAVEQGFNSKASFSHGFKAIGRNFPDASIGWYRKSFTIPHNDLGRRIHIAFDGVFRNSIVWVNGHYLGTQPSGYQSFEYDITDYLNYGAENSVAVRVDATMEEGWFYEGAGIYRHVWLNKLDELHIASNGTFVTSKIKKPDAAITIQTKVVNDGNSSKTFSVTQDILDANGKSLASSETEKLNLNSFESKEISSELKVADAKLWSIDTPYLHHLITTIKQGENVIDRYETKFGIRRIHFDANEGFFLNGNRVKIKGTNNHQDHAGLGSAIPDALQEFRIRRLKEMGSNAYRCSHNPPTPELLDVCDRLGMVVIDENRLMGTASTELGDLKKLIIRDRNHPCVISWSIGNEEWGIENNITGARIATTMQAFARSIDSTRYITAAFSGGVGSGISNVMELMGYNYVMNKNTDEHHKNHPKQFSWGTEEGSTVATRGIYANNIVNHERAAYDERQAPSFLSIEEGWKHYASRPYLAGMFIWTGFDYRGEPSPYGYPSTGSYFGMMDQCGFAKDDVFYLKSWWKDEPLIHILPHWNWIGEEGKSIPVWVYSNADEIELFLNDKSMGKKRMERNGHLNWNIPYSPGTLRAVGTRKDEPAITDIVKTTGQGTSINLSSNVKSIQANKEDLVMISVDLKDKNGSHVPTALNQISFTLKGPGKIIGVGNGNPTSLEPDKFLETTTTISLLKMKEKIVESLENRPEIAANFNDAKWEKAFTDERTKEFAEMTKAIVYRASFELSAPDLKGNVTFFYNSIGKTQSVYVNGKEVGAHLPQNKQGTFLS